MDTKVNKQRERKEKIVAEISEKVGKAKALVFTNYQGMTHRQLEVLKKALRSVEAELVVTKNTLLKRSLQQLSTLNFQLSTFEGPTATLFSYDDPIAALKELAKTIRTIKLPAIKFGLAKRDPALQDIHWQLLAEEELIRLSTLPSREVLLAQLVGGIKAPLYGLHRALSWNMKKLVLTLKTIEQRKESA